MHATPRLPLLRRVPPGAWIAIAWCAITVYSFGVLVGLPGEGPGPLFTLTVIPPQWVNMVWATLVVMAGSALLRRRPLPAVVLLVLGSMGAAMALNSTEINLLQFLTVDIAVCFVAADRSRRVSLIALGLAVFGLVGYATVRMLMNFVIGASTELAVALTAAVTWFIGNSTHQSRLHAEKLAVQATEQAVTAERLRIARELHDMVAHSIGIIALQAGAASRVIHTQPARAQAALGEVETTSRETLAGLRRMLGALRQAGPESAAAGAAGPSGLDSATAMQAMPGLADVEDLAAGTTAAGVPVEVCWTGERRRLPPEIDLSAFRIIQESLTNVVRHAGPGDCRVSIEYGEEELSIEVVDSGQGPAAPTDGTGYGLVGMRERITLLRGEFSAAPRPDGGFRVAVRLPVPAVAS